MSDVHDLPTLQCEHVWRNVISHGRIVGYRCDHCKVLTDDPDPITDARQPEDGPPPGRWGR